MPARSATARRHPRYVSVSWGVTASVVVAVGAATDGHALHAPGALVQPSDLLPLTLVDDGPHAATGAAKSVPKEPAPAPAPEPQPMEEAFAGIVGQDPLLKRLDRTARGARARGRPFPHTLFVGPPGTGKTTLARGIAACAGARIVERLGPLLQDTPELARILASLGDGDVLFLDEIHAVPRSVLELLYDALATGEGFVMEPDAAACLAHGARGTPREALRLLDRALDEAASRGAQRLGRRGAARTLRHLGFDADGLDPMEQRYLALLHGAHQPVALRRLARMLGTSARSLIEHVEPFLFRRGLVEMTAQGRSASARSA